MPHVTRHISSSFFLVLVGLFWFQTVAAASHQPAALQLYWEAQPLSTYDQSVIGLYQQHWQTSPRLDELQFHRDHATPLDRLEKWLAEHPNTIKDCWYPAGATKVAADQAATLFAPYALGEVDCGNFVQLTIQPPSVPALPDWLVQHAIDFVPDHVQPDGQFVGGGQSNNHVAAHATVTLSLAISPLPAAVSRLLVSPPDHLFVVSLLHPPQA